MTRLSCGRARSSRRVLRPSGPSLGQQVTNKPEALQVVAPRWWSPSSKEATTTSTAADLAQFRAERAADVLRVCCGRFITALIKRGSQLSCLQDFVIALAQFQPPVLRRMRMH